MMRSVLFLLLIIASTYIDATTKVIALSGSTRTGSYNQALASTAAEIARNLGAQATLINLKNYDLPFYDADLEATSGMPAQAKALRRQLLQNDLIIIASPEYNHSVSAVLKNALDWVSRGERGGFDRASFKGKRVLLLSTSPGQGGGGRGLTHLKAIIEDIGATAIPGTLSVPRAHQAFNAEGQLVDGEAKRNLQQLIQQAL